MERAAGTIKRKAKYATDLRIEDQGEIEGLLAGQSLLGFHATRLLPHELEAIRAGGLRLLDDDLIPSRIESARAVGTIDDDQAAEFVRAVQTNYEKHRDTRGQRVGVAVGTAVFSRDPWGFSSLLRVWGGEVLFDYYTRKDPNYQVLLTLGRASMVVIDLDLDPLLAVATARDRDRWLRALVGARLGLPDAYLSVPYPQDIPGRHILTILDSADPEFRALGDLYQD